MNPLVTEVWPQFGADPDFAAAFAGVRVERVELHRAERTVLLCLYSAVPLDSALCGRLCASLAPLFNGFSLRVRDRFPFASITPAAVAAMVEELKEQGMPVNGFLHKTQPVTLTPDGLTVHVTAGRHILETVDLPGRLAALIGERTGTVPAVRLEDSAVPDLPEQAPAAPRPAPQRFAAQKPLKPFTVPGLALTGTPPHVFLGHAFKPAELRPLNDLGEGGKVTVWGDVFAADIKGSRRRIYLTSITDYNGSVTLKAMEGSDAGAAKWENLKKGTTLIVRGSYTYDKYERDYVILPYDVLTVERAPRTDDAPDGQKRVELHLHTKLSAMDAFCDPGSIVRLAHGMGHRAVAITDHGVCQAYPEAMLAAEAIRKTDPGFKLIYGCEAYFVDDMVPAVYGGASQPLTGRYVVFDTETTGLDPLNDRMTEIGAVLVEDGAVVEGPKGRFATFVDPGCPIPPRITELTGITDAMVAGAPAPDEVIRRFREFCGDAVLVAHNAGSFDMPLIRKAAERAGFGFANTYVDTLPLAQALYPGLHNYKLDTVNRHLGLAPFGHHRAVDDAAALAGIFERMLADLSERGLSRLEEVNAGLGGSGGALTRQYYHLILLVQNQTGLKNLYRLVSEAHTRCFHQKPRIPRSLLDQYREGLLLGSACEAGELYRAITAGRPWEELLRIADYYDYLEVQPLGNNEFMVREGKVPSMESIEDFNRTVVRLGEALHKPVVATGDVHFQEPADSIYRSVLQAGKEYKDADSQPPLFYRTTPDMLGQFAYLGAEKAYELVVTNPNKLAATIENEVRAIPRGTYPPDMPGSEQMLRESTWQNARAAYGDPLPEILQKRLQKELDSICGHGYAVLYMIAVKLVAYSNAGGYQVGSRGSVGSSAVAHFSGISEVNSMPPHYLCPCCKHSEWIDDGVHFDGFDLPDKNCPVCGTPMKMDGHDIPFETFLGFYGDKEPDIDLNFSGMYQSSVHRYTEELFGKENVFKAGTVSGLQDKTAFGYVRKYLEERGRTVNRAEENRLTIGCTGVKRTTGQHPGGMVVVPDTFSIYDFCPIQHPADDVKGGLLTTHFEFKYLHDTLLKLDELGHDVPTFYKYFEEYTGIPVDTIPMNDEKVYSLLTSPEALGVTAEQIGSETGTFGIPEMGTDFVRRMLLDARPKNFSELIQISGLSHGTDVWNGNADELIRSGTCTIADVIGCRDSIMLYLLRKGLEPKMAFDIMEAVRKGKVAKEGFKPGWEEAMRAHDVPDWYIASCRKIKYMFPKAHAVAYLMAAIRLMWFKVYRPAAFYAVYFTVRGADIDYEAAIGGVKVAKEHIRANERIPKEERTAKDDDTLVSLQIVNEMLQRGGAFLPIELGKSYGSKFVLEDGKIRLPFIAIRGLGGAAAQALEEATMHGQQYLSVEELQQATGVGATMLDRLRALGALGDLPQTNQVDLFSMVS